MVLLLFLVGVTAYIIIGRLRLTLVIPNDEYVYGNAAQSVAAGDGLTWRGAGIGQRTLYPYLISPAWVLSDGESAFNIAKAIGAVTMCAAVWPTWLVARSVIRDRWAFLPPALLLLGLWMEASSAIMTEALAFPAGTCALCFTVIALQRGRGVWLASALVAAAVAAGTRTQLGILFAVVAVAVAGDVARHPRAEWAPRARDRRTWLILTWSIVAVGLVAALGPMNDALGSYAGVTGSSPPLSDALRWANDYGVELALMVAVVPLVLAVALVFSREAWSDDRVGPFVVVLAAALLVFLPFTGWFAAAIADRIIERYIYYLIPLVLVGGVVGARQASWRAALGVTVALGAAVMVMHDPLRGAGQGSRFLPGAGEDTAFRTAGRDILGWATPVDGRLGGIAMLVVALGAVAATALFLRAQERPIPGARRTVTTSSAAFVVLIALVTGWLLDQSQQRWSDIHVVTTYGLRTFFGGRVPRLNPDARGPITLVALEAAEPQVLGIEFFNKHVTQVVARSASGSVFAGYGPTCELHDRPDGRFALGTACDRRPGWFAVASMPAVAVPTLRAGRNALDSFVPWVRLVSGAPQLLALSQPLCSPEAGICQPVSIRTFTERAAVMRITFRPGQRLHRVAIAQGGAPRIEWIRADAPTTITLPVRPGTTLAQVQPDWQQISADAPSLSSMTLQERGRPPVRLN